ncbi:hypothetical protein [Pimelobacter simplex]|uniref:hypothetical protein n=1 Tax=Nocardioides simplex TaxID=2045 RepID=UPI003AAF47A9
MWIKVLHHIDDLARDLASVPDRASQDVRSAVRHGALSGNVDAKDRVRKTVPGPFHRTFTWDQPRAVDGAGWSSEFGPSSDPPTGGAGPVADALELSREPAMDVVTRDIEVVMDEWFRPGRERR